MNRRSTIVGLIIATAILITALFYNINSSQFDIQFEKDKFIAHIKLNYKKKCELNYNRSFTLEINNVSKDKGGITQITLSDDSVYTPYGIGSFNGNFEQYDSIHKEEKTFDLKLIKHKTDKVLYLKNSINFNCDYWDNINF